MMGGLKEPRLGLARIGERSPLEPEQFGFHERVGNRRTVHVDERRLGPRAASMHELGEEALARASFAEQQDRRDAAGVALALEEALDSRAKGLDRWTLADQLVEALHARIVAAGVRRLKGGQS